MLLGGGKGNGHSYTIYSIGNREYTQSTKKSQEKQTGVLTLWPILQYNVFLQGFHLFPAFLWRRGWIENLAVLAVQPYLLGWDTLCLHGRCKWLATAQPTVKFRKGGWRTQYAEISCYVPINPKNAIVRGNMASVKEWRQLMAARCWLVEEPKEGKGSPIKKGHLVWLFLIIFPSKVLSSTMHHASMVEILVRIDSERKGIHGENSHHQHQCCLSYCLLSRQIGGASRLSGVCP